MAGRRLFWGELLEKNMFRPLPALEMPQKAVMLTLLWRSCCAGGWGPGLTPSGDDFLAGLMLSLWVQKGS
jgi:hypothetical protein